MKDIKLEIYQLKNYLGTGLKVIARPWSNETFTLSGLDECPDEKKMIFLRSESELIKRWIEDIQPICYQLSDLDKLIPELGFVPLDRLPFKTIDWSQEMDLHDGFKIMGLLFEWNFWVFDQSYFEKGLILNKMKI